MFYLFTDTHCNKKTDGKEQDAKTAVHSVEKKRKTRRTKSEAEKKNKNIYRAIKKSLKTETANRTRRDTSGSQTREEGDGIAVKRRRGRPGWEQGPEEKGR